MLLKKFSYLLLAGCISTFAISCDDEDDTIPEVVDTTDPTATISSPTQEQLEAGFMAGDSITVTATVSDDRDLESVTLSFAAPGENPPGWIRTWAEADFSGNTVEINETIDIPADAAEGTYVLTLTAHDDADNTFTQSWNINVMAAPEPNVTFNVTVPAGTPSGAQVFLVGQMTGWGEDQDGTWELTDEDADGIYTGSFNISEESLAEGNGYKFRIKSDDANDAWKFVEKDAACLEINDRPYTFSAEMQTVDATVENWRNISPCGN